MQALYEKLLNFLGFETVDEGDSSLRNPLFDRKRVEVRILNPRSFEEVTALTEALNGGHGVIMNLSNMGREEAKRTTDFAFGSVYAVGGAVQSLGDHQYLFAPPNLQIVNGVPPTATVSRPAPATEKPKGRDGKFEGGLPLAVGARG